jgi:ferritin-like metal-binding protein YciE
MNYLNKAILNKYKNHWYTLRDAGFIANLTRSQVEELESVYKQEIDANYTVNKWCMSCVTEMVRILYLATKFDTQVEEKENPTAYQTISDPVNDFAEEKFSDSPVVQELLEAFSDDEIVKATIASDEQVINQPKKRGRKKRK